MSGFFVAPLATLPSKQGLKPQNFQWRIVQIVTSCYTSIKTRIETKKHGQGVRSCAASCYTSIKTRIETGKRDTVRCRRSSSCYTSIKTRIETNRRASHRTCPAIPSCYTSIKTRIETFSATLCIALLLASCYTSIKTRIETTGQNASCPNNSGCLLLHFHQNKD